MLIEKRMLGTQRRDRCIVQSTTGAQLWLPVGAGAGKWEEVERENGSGRTRGGSSRH